MKKFGCNTLLPSTIRASVIFFSTIIKAADWDFLWVVKNDTPKEIPAEIGASQYPWCTTQIANAAFASTPTGPEAQNIQARDFPSLAAYAETAERPLCNLSHIRGYKWG